MRFTDCVELFSPTWIYCSILILRLVSRGLLYTRSGLFQSRGVILRYSPCDEDGPNLIVDLRASDGSIVSASARATFIFVEVYYGATSPSLE